MTINMGIVGPKDSVDKAIQVVDSMGNNINSIPLIYTNHHQIKLMVDSVLTRLDCLLFTGVLPYSLMYEELKDKLPIAYIGRDTNTVMRTVFEIVYLNKRMIDKVSFDVFKKTEVLELFEEINIPTDHVYVLEHAPGMVSDDITEHHLSLYNNKKVNICITCSLITYIKLKELGIPIFRVVPSRSSIKQTIEMLLLEFKSSVFQKSAITIGVISIDNNLEDEKYSSSYDLERIQLKLHDLLLSFAQKTQSSIVRSGDEFFIYSTYGELISNNLALADTEILEQSYNLFNISLSYGIGTGLTVQDAKNNAKIAIKHARQTGNCIFIKEHSGQIIGPISPGKTDSINWLDADVINMLSKKTGINNSILAKALYIVDKKLGATFTVQQFAEVYKCTLRNARRILTLLEKADVISIESYEQHLSAGRPKKVYMKNKSLENK